MFADLPLCEAQNPRVKFFSLAAVTGRYQYRGLILALSLSKLEISSGWGRGLLATNGFCFEAR
jgi:hypothetical protein